MSYNVNIPIITDPILQSSAQIKANFQSIAVAFAVNHGALTSDSTLSGKHTIVVFRPQSADPVTTATTVALYNKLVSSVPELFYEPINAQTPIQLTYPSIKVDSTATQYSFVAGPFIIYGGKLTGVTQGQIVTLTPGANLLYVDLILTNGSGSAANVSETIIPTAIAGNSFTISMDPSRTVATNIFYFAIGN